MEIYKCIIPIPKGNHPLHTPISYHLLSKISTLSLNKMGKKENVFCIFLTQAERDYLFPPLTIGYSAEKDGQIYVLL